MLGIIGKEESLVATYSENSGCSQVPAPLHRTKSTEPVVIPQPAIWLEDAYERIVPHAIWAVQHGYQRLVVVPDDTDTVMRLLHFIHMIAHDSLRKTSRASSGQVRRDGYFLCIARLKEWTSISALFWPRLTYSQETMLPAELAPIL